MASGSGPEVGFSASGGCKGWVSRKSDISYYMETCKDARVQQDEIYPSTGNLQALNRSSQTPSVSQFQMTMTIVPSLRNLRFHCVAALHDIRLPRAAGSMVEWVDDAESETKSDESPAVQSLSKQPPVPPIIGMGWNRSPKHTKRRETRTAEGTR